MMEYLKDKKYLNDILLIALMLISLLGWGFDKSLRVAIIYVFFGMFNVIYLKDIRYFIPLVLFTLVSFNYNILDNSTMTALAVTILILLIIDFRLNRRSITNVGKLGSSLLVFIIISIFSYGNAQDTNLWLISVLFFTILFLIYVYYINSIRYSITNLDLIIKTLCYLTIEIAIQMIIFIIRSDSSLYDIIILREMNLGWETSSIIAYPSLIAIPLVGYYITKSKVKLPYMFLIGLQALIIFFTLNHIAIISCLIYIAFLIPLISIFDKYKPQLMLQSLVFLFVLFAITYIIYSIDYLNDIFVLFNVHEWSIDGTRLDVLDLGTRSFLKNPLFGTGGFFSSRTVLEANGYSQETYHNTIVQITTLGIFGLLTLIYFLKVQFTLLLRSMRSYCWFMVLLLSVLYFVAGNFLPLLYVNIIVSIFLIGTIEKSTIKVRKYR